ncbi:MAG: 1-deoxy-D-xylulose-5-phosphate synthase [bacterium]|nr:1-deoxy-D-xylulose-5-phosphate synthase [bacterium]
MGQLDRIHSVSDLRTLSQSDLQTLVSELQGFLVTLGEQCGGHLASNLGVIELTLALHLVFDTPQDKLVWDVSHQCYIHKLLTGRRHDLFSIRQYNGLSGFAKMAESPHDSFGAGHAGTALSAALGMAHARDLAEDDHAVISIMGDGTLSNGMVFEALNNIGNLNTNFICILNDNDMSISKPTGSLATYMTQLRTSKAYDLIWKKTDQLLSKMPAISQPLTQRIEKALSHFRDLVLNVKVDVLFEEFGFKYLGPLDGHDLPTLVTTLQYAKTYPGPIMIHMVTKKGNGYAKAEADPLRYHGVSPKKKASAPPQKTYSHLLGDTLIDIAKQTPELVVVTPAMAVGSGLVSYSEQFPKQFIDVGIAEEHAVTYCAGIASNGGIPVLAIYSTFLQRGYDQLIHDVCLQQLPVIFAIDRAGLVGEDGPTHHGVFDYAFMLSIPNLVILAPKDGTELAAMLWWATQQRDTAVAIRYPKGVAPSLLVSPRPFTHPSAEVLLDTESPSIVLIAIGSLVPTAYAIGTALSDQGHRIAVINLRSAKPLDTDCLTPYMDTADHVFVLEEGTEIGGVGSYIRQQYYTRTAMIHTIGIPDRFIDHGKNSELHADVGLSESAIHDRIVSVLA